MRVLQPQFLPDTIALQRNAITKGKCGLFQTSQTCLASQLPPTGLLAPDWTNFHGSINLKKSPAMVVSSSGKDMLSKEYAAELFLEA